MSRNVWKLLGLLVYGLGHGQSSPDELWRSFESLVIMFSSGIQDNRTRMKEYGAIETCMPSIMGGSVQGV